MNRRRLLIGLTTLIASPPIVRASSLMSVVAVPAFDIFDDWKVIGTMIVHVENLPNGELDIKVGAIEWRRLPLLDRLLVPSYRVVVSDPPMIEDQDGHGQRTDLIDGEPIRQLGPGRSGQG